VGPSYLSTNLADPTAAAAVCMKDDRKGRHFPHSTAMDARRQALLQRKPPCVVEFLPVGFGKVWQQHLRGREGLIA
jgi:hypothetical protein